MPEPVLGASQEARLLTALQEGRSLAQLAGATVGLGHFYGQFGAQTFRQPPGGQGTGAWSRGTGGPEQRCRNVVQMRWRGDGQCTSRGEVVDMGFKVAEIFASIHPHGTAEFDVSFQTPILMELFFSRYEVLKAHTKWRDFRVVAISRQEENKSVTILVKNESLPQEDIAT